MRRLPDRLPVLGLRRRGHLVCVWFRTFQTSAALALMPAGSRCMCQTSGSNEFDGVLRRVWTSSSSLYLVSKS